MEYLNYILFSAIAIVGYFLKDVHSNLKEYKKASDLEQLRMIEEIGKLKGKIEMVQVQSSNELKRIEELTQLKLDQIGKDVSKLSSDLQEYLKRNSSQN